MAMPGCLRHITKSLEKGCQYVDIPQGGFAGLTDDGETF